MLAFDDRVEALIEFEAADDSEMRLLNALTSLAAEQDADLRVELLRGMARVQSLQRRYGDAHGSLDRAEGRLAQAAPASRAKLLYERALVWEEQGEVGRAVGCLESALDHCKSHPDCDRVERDAAYRLPQSRRIKADTPTFCQSVVYACLAWVTALTDTPGDREWCELTGFVMIGEQ